MSVDVNPKLFAVATARCRELRRNSTESEKILWERLRNRKLLNKKFNRQRPIFFDLLGKNTFYISDFYCHEKKLVIEVDGKIHESQEEKDALRSEVINSLGIKVIRFKNEEIENSIDKVLNEIKTELQ